MKITSLPPIASKNAAILILGSMPGDTSLRLQQYYAYSNNSFWQIMEAICGAKKGMPYSEREQHLKGSGIAIWDVLQHCEREGSLDTNIKSESEVPNDFEGFLQLYPNIHYIFFNGQKAFKSFRKLVLPKLPPQIRGNLKIKTLPSTSSANTHLSREQKQAVWQKQITSALA